VTLRLVALGDSTSCGEGVGLRLPAELTWPALLGGALPGSALLSLAAPGARLRDVLASQVQRAAAHAPHVVTLLVGLNDISRGGFDARSFAVDLRAALALLAPSEPVVLLGRLHDPTRLLPLPPALRRTVQERRAAVNAAVDAACADGGGRVLALDLSQVAGLEARAAWEVDRLHPNRAGHALLAAAAAGVLRQHGLAVGPVPVPPTGRAPGRLDEAGWLVRSGLPWLAGHLPQVVVPAVGAALPVRVPLLR
jgi:lysophospholipase L1-like esterase